MGVGMTLLKIVVGIVLILVTVQTGILIVQISEACWKYFLCPEHNLQDRYGANTWVMITGPSAGQGRQFALQFAKRGFHILMIGSKRCTAVQKEITDLYGSRIQTRLIEKDFCRAFEKNFFDDIEHEVKQLGTRISVLVNNVGHRVAWKPYHDMPLTKLYGTISAGTIVQARLIHMMLPILLNRAERSAIIVISAQCVHPNIALGVYLPNELSVPYLSAYEAANAFGYFHANSIYKEYKDQLDFLNVAPGAVKTTRTTAFLKDVPFAVECEDFVANVIRMLGNINGTTYGHWKHSFAMYGVNFLPWLKDKVLQETGEKICKHYVSQNSNTL